MRTAALVVKELANRRADFVSGIVAVAVGIAVGVGVRTLTQPTAESVMARLHGLGSGFVVMPRQASVSDYLLGRGSSETLPIEAVELLSSSGIEGLENLTPLLWSRVQVDGRMAILTGVLPLSEIKDKSDYTVANLFSTANSPQPATEEASASHCDKPPNASGPMSQEPAGRDATIITPEIPASSMHAVELSGEITPPAKLPLFDTMGSREIVAGSEVANVLNLNRGSRIQIRGMAFSVADILTSTGGIDDLRLYAHLNTVQQLLDVSAVVNAIEVLGCCVDRKGSFELIARIERLLPEAKVVTIRGVVDARQETVAMAGRISAVLLMVLLAVGGTIISLQMAANVHERRVEIGTLVALGANRRVVLALVLARALTLGTLGGLTGYASGTAMGVFLAPHLTGFHVEPLLSLLPISLLLAAGIALLSSLLPLYRTIKLDPALALMDQ